MSLFDIPLISGSEVKFALLVTPFGSDKIDDDCEVVFVM